MSKKPTYESTTVAIPYWEIGVLWGKNYSRMASPFNPEAVKTKELITSIADFGIQDDHPLVIVKATPDEVAEMVADRQTILSNLLAVFQDKPTKANEHALKVRQYLWLDEKGNVKKPNYRVGSGNTRHSSTPFAMTLRAIRADSFEYESIIGDPKWSCKVYDSLTKSELVQLQILENQLNTTGTTVPTDRDNYLAVLELVGLGANEAECRRAYKDGKGRQLYYAALLTNRFPALDLKERFLSDDPNFMFSLSKIHHNDDKIVVVRTNKTMLDAQNVKNLAAGTPILEPMTEADVFEWMERKMGRLERSATDPVTVKALDKKKIANVVENSPNEVVKASLKAVQTGDMKYIEGIMPITDGINALTKIGPHEGLMGLLKHLAALELTVREEAISQLLPVAGKFKVASPKETPVTVEA